MRIEPTADLELVRQILTHPRIYPHIADDFSPQREAYQPVDHPGVTYALVYADSGILLGCFVFWMHSPVLYEVHTALLPSAWGPAAAEAARAAAEWLFSTTKAQRIITQIPEYNRLAARFARAAGMQHYGSNPACYLKAGRLQTINLYGLSKEPATCPQQ